MPCITATVMQRNPDCAQNLAFPESPSTILMCTDASCWEKALKGPAPPVCMPCTTFGVGFVNSAAPPGGFPWARHAPPCCEKDVGRSTVHLGASVDAHPCCKVGTRKDGSCVPCGSVWDRIG
ncbi:hypothetical protein EMIHUDRAFT_444720 [Emiliania huxleyi CCMP1516]|uniref:Uncharacterized protein n=2 Tax=Emiliania huxleyi TaxID=2903 RepID=A0A0D3J9T5_EMIH1|nr:hypothetical protein EMIHUDRAFT_436566 [Emiliania huxleyi CCMP1516]XP_005772699.1 hypothetical protein EMIHUDRAFT_444720 [Emiliania huxleyi CCMP1516]EOD16323.1 hypothetical protein EMIHUDRAFT_436566 [Emiliania huxleyi CCMP1516]EOD20270.1 hypothetical protein EMIHUDRAFT_444720 [Emiliania huxleyi CCMP1516]|eukprot:XP_005768752.1 hypothetical protein EMIHUDRAFT_436566 [Emiliania huxleyi CCMP1516]